MLPAVQADEEDMSDEEYSGYLHPSLLAKSASQPSVPAVAPPQYTQSQLENTAYGKLLKKMVINQPQLTNSPQRSVTPTYRYITISIAAGDTVLGFNYNFSVFIELRQKPVDADISTAVSKVISVV